MNWKREVERAEKELRASAERINSTARGTPSGRRTDWKVGQSPGTRRETR